MILKVIHDSFRIDNVVPETPSVETESRTTGFNLYIPRPVLRRTAAGSPSRPASPSLARLHGDWPRDISIVTEGSIAGDTVQIRDKLYPDFDTASRYHVFYKPPEGRTVTRLGDRYPASWPVSVTISLDWFRFPKGYEWSPVRGRVVHGILEGDYFLESEGDEAFEGHGLNATHIEGTTQEMDLQSGKRRCTEFEFYHPKDLQKRHRLSVYYVWNKNSRRLHSMSLSEAVLDFLRIEALDSSLELLRSKKDIVESDISHIEDVR
jgi:hypothetical protein